MAKYQKMGLSKAQEEAVGYIGAALVVAGAGSGKTRTLIAKIIHLINSGYSPEQILAITFTNKAAEEMKSRLFQATGLSQERFPWVRTYHSACFKILKQHCAVLGYKIPLQIYSEYQQQKVVKDILLERNIDKKYLHAVCSHISAAKNSGHPETYLNSLPRLSFLPLNEIYQTYEDQLYGKNAVDFDNILLMARNLLRDHPDIRSYYHSLFTYILVDEYQDTNDLQEEISRLLLGHKNIFCVGDDWQAIYGFRGSNMNHFLNFTDKYKEAKIFRLEQNYRSTGEIVKAANTLISNNPRQMKKDCFSVRTGGAIELHRFFDDGEESAWVSGKIQELHRSNMPYDGFGVLYRTKFCSLPFEKALRASGIPYRMYGSKGFFERKEIVDLTSYLTAAVFVKDDAAFERILNTPKRGIGVATLNKFNKMRRKDVSLQETIQSGLINNAVSSNLTESLKRLIGLLDHIKDLSPKEALEKIIRQTGYLEHLREYAQSEEDYTARLENIEQLKYSASGHETLIDFLEEASLIKEDKHDEQDSKDGVRLSTIHASKGLEYKAVFVVGCEENLLPHWKSKESNLESEIDEERRLMYVAMTRAESFLYITSASYRMGQFNLKSRFIEEIEQDIDLLSH